MRAIILAAGAGTRLGPLTDGRPKCLVPVGGWPLLDYQLDALRRSGVDEVVLVLGYEADRVRAHCGRGAVFVDNADWERTNSIYSLFLARHYLEGDTLLFNCDILFHPDAIGRLLREGSAIAVDSRAARLAGEMNVRVDGDGWVAAIGKHLDPGAAQAVSVQLARFDRDGARQVRGEVERLVREEVKDAFPTSAYGPLIAAGRLRAVEAGDLPWGEIDSAADLERVAASVVPRLPSPPALRAPSASRAPGAGSA